MVCAVVYSQMPVVVATVLAISAFITSCFYSILNSARNNMSTAYFECITFWKFEAKRSKKQEEAKNEYTENAGRLLRRANWCAGLYKDYCIIVRWWFSSVILMFLFFLVIMAASTFSQSSHFWKCVFGILFFLSIISITIPIIATKIKHPYKSKLLNYLKYLNFRILLLHIFGIFNPHLADEKRGEIKKEICTCPKWFEENETESKEF